MGRQDQERHDKHGREAGTIRHRFLLARLVPGGARPVPGGGRGASVRYMPAAGKAYLAEYGSHGNSTSRSPPAR